MIAEQRRLFYSFSFSQHGQLTENNLRLLLAPTFMLLNMSTTTSYSGSRIFSITSSSMRSFKYAVYKHALHVDPLLPVQQISACILALSGNKASILCFSLQIFCSKEVARSAIKSPKQLVS